VDIQEIIIKAIRSKCKVTLNYKWEGMRIVCPHVIYRSSTGKILVDTYQVSGYSNHPADIPGWRPFDISKITELNILNETFDLADGYNPLSERYTNSIAKI